MRTPVPPANPGVLTFEPPVAFGVVAELPDLRTKIAKLRVARRVSQADLAQVSGLSLITLRRLERGEIGNPPIRYLANVAMALDVPLEDVIEPEWVAWTHFTSGPAKPPDGRWVQRLGAGWTRSPHARRDQEQP
jgi:transcriptional regulator with XRE-family HTH domain